VRDRIRGRAASLYRRISAGSPLPLPDTANYTEQARHRRYLEAAELPDQELAKSLELEIGRLRTEERSQRDAQAMLQRDADNAARLKRKLTELARQAAARRAATTHDGAGPVATTPAPVAGAASPTSTPAPTPTGGPGTTATTRPVAPPTPPPPTNPPPPSSSRGATAVAYARAQLGKPYVFAAAGPDTFDCSGLTMAAWAAAGVRMPHYSGSQATMFPKVGWDQLQPGDIVVFYDDLHHVGLYIGGGQMIHAPQTGDVVKIAPAWRTTFQWGVRPG
jgi:cell wall-associated NlpC family hydrolase